MDSSDPYGLIGAKAGDAADVRPCQTEGCMILARGLKVHDWDGGDRLVSAPPQVEGGPFTEMRLAPDAASAVVAAIGRRRAGSEQPILQVVQDVLDSAVYVVRATGVRIKDRHSDSRLVGGTPGLRKEGENARSRLIREDRELELVHSGAAASAGEESGSGPMSDEWTTLDAYLEEAVAAVEIPCDSALRSIKADWCLVASIPRIKLLEEAGALQFEYLGTSVVRFRDLLKVKDTGGRSAGGRFAYFLARELAHDIFSVRRQHGFKEWLRFATATLGCASSLGGIGWLLSQLTSIIS
jgi:hypothetical protein